MRDNGATTGSSPASTGPAGSHFEGQVGAHYLLSLLTNAEPRGLPGTLIDRVELQRASEGRALDDIIVRARDSLDRSSVLEIQVKRDITFAPGDSVFRGVVRQIATASQRLDFWNSNYRLAIATAKMSHKIAGPYQDVLKSARELESATTFFSRLNRRGTGNKDMRTFVETFRTRLGEVGAINDEDAVWRLLQRIQILVFDFTADGSASAYLALERAVRALHSNDASQARLLWSVLIERALDVAASGGARTRLQLQEELRERAFRLTGDRRYAAARTALAEVSHAALADIDDCVGDVRLKRPERLAAVHAALDQGHYVEIRGDAGVGKSGLLKHFAMQLGAEARTIVLSPGYTTPRGWVEMRSVLGFDGTASDLLADLASSGAAILFIDNLDFFTGEERRTVVDLVRAAADVSGVSVIATTRPSLESDNASWLPRDALDRLGRAIPVTVDELSNIEVDDLREAAPQLSALLADSHPAREVSRNLFRLSRLLRLAVQPDGLRTLRTEIDMAEQWWETADGQRDDLHRDRGRLLRFLADHVLLGPEPVDVHSQPAEAIDALIASETLRDVRNDRGRFRHDVLAEWAIGCRLSSHEDAIDRLPLAQPAPARLARGVELAARIALERSEGTAKWEALLARLTRQGVHGSWRRAVLLASVRSEAGISLLARASTLLAANRASLLKELIRTVMAVDVTPFSDALMAAGVDPAPLPMDVDLPSNFSWFRLITWLLDLGSSVPVPAIPDVVDLYTAWSVGRLGHDPLTPSLISWLHHWLTEVEAHRVGNQRHRSIPFGGQLGELDALEINLRNGFLLFCDKTPQLAASYLRGVMALPRNEDIVSSILKCRGALAKAAPRELADLTVAALVQAPTDGAWLRRERVFDGPFTRVDLEFSPASPARGPFLDLLTYAPKEGLRLIRRLIDHAVTFYMRGRVHGTDAFVIPFADGTRVFPWIRSYNWSRGGGGESSVASGLMALEAWAHSRIDSGEDFGRVLGDVLDEPDAPTCYVLVAVDLLLSHWPASANAAGPFLGCPELVCVDVERQVDDQIGTVDIFGIQELGKEPPGAATLDSLKKLPSRRRALNGLLSHYAISQPPNTRTTLAALLRRASERLGVPDPEASLRDPSLMTVHALNLIDPMNYREEDVELPDGSKSRGWQYVPPDAEREHFERLQEGARGLTETANMQTALGLALEDRTRSSASFAAAAVEWAQSAAAPNDTDESWMQEHAIVTAAMIAMRDGDSELLARHFEWAHEIFDRALEADDDVVHRVREGLRFNPIAIALVGLIHALKERCGSDDIRNLLRAALRPAAVHGVLAEVASLTAIDERLPRSIFRCGLVTCIHRVRQWDANDDETVAAAIGEQRKSAAIEAEIAWLSGSGSEPAWPVLPSHTPAPRRRLINGESSRTKTERGYEPLEEWFADQMGALWLRGVKVLGRAEHQPWAFDFVRTYAQWTWAANGLGLSEHEECSSPPREWNDAYFDLLAHGLPGLTASEAEHMVLTPMCSLPDDSFCEVAAAFLRSADDVYFNDLGMEESLAVLVRSTLAQHLARTNSWRWQARRRDNSIGMTIAPIVATCFFNDYGYGLRPTRVYLLPKGIDKLSAFLPALEVLVADAPCHFVASVALNLLEVSPRSQHVPFLVAAATTWLCSFPDSKDFWIDHAFGRRVCVLLEGARKAKAECLSQQHPIRRAVDGLLATLIQIGVAEAARLERSFGGSGDV